MHISWDQEEIYQGQNYGKIVLSSIIDEGVSRSSKTKNAAWTKAVCYEEGTTGSKSGTPKNYPDFDTQ